MRWSRSISRGWALRHPGGCAAARRWPSPMTSPVLFMQRTISSITSPGTEMRAATSAICGYVSLRRVRRRWSVRARVSVLRMLNRSGAAACCRATPALRRAGYRARRPGGRRSFRRAAAAVPCGFSLPFLGLTNVVGRQQGQRTFMTEREGCLVRQTLAGFCRIQVRAGVLWFIGGHYNTGTSIPVAAHRAWAGLFSSRLGCP